MIERLLKDARELGASDVHIIAGSPVMVRIDGVMQALNQEILNMADTAQCAEEMGILELKEETNFAYEDVNGRYRASAYLRQDTLALAVRIISNSVPSIESLNLPEFVAKFADLTSGLVIVTGHAGSGKTTTMAALLDRINALYPVHIVTLEDPVEYKHLHRRALINQREIGKDTKNYASGLNFALHMDSDVILVGELCDGETIKIALNAAENGHLVLAAMQTKDATEAINRILDLCADQSGLVRNQLAGSLQGIIAQQLLPKTGGGRIAACEILTATPVLRGLIREGKISQIPNFIQSGSQYGMQNMEVAILKLRRDGLVK